ncbi:FIST signal transduction protein [Gaetbulibacter aestuarii]|uniref:FIST N-terminal domain-containing protein n=1 Tax=Gaetbulibacter aestuarii TaxID=1502358 RepID=A0ABW7MW12_9FLAO
MISKAIKGFSTLEIETHLNEALSDGFQPTLAFAFISKSQDRQAITALMDAKNITVFGCTTNGEFIDETPQKGSAAILLMDMNRNYFQIYFEPFSGNKYKEIATRVAKKANEQYPKPSFLLGISGASADGEEVLRGIESVIGPGVNVFGGAAGDDFNFSETFVFTNRKDSDNALVCVALDESKIDVKGIATCGWKAVGTEKIVTKSDGNHVYTVDNVPVLDITAKYGGLENVTPENNNLLVEIASNFPLQLQREKGDPIMRPGLVVDWSDHSFYTSGTVPQGSKVRFSLPPDFDVIDKVVEGVKKLKVSEMPEADALIVFSCAGRILSLGPLMTKELEGVKEVWNVPMAGMFSNGELGRATGGNLEMHNLTTCCVALKEKN